MQNNGFKLNLIAIFLKKRIEFHEFIRLSRSVSLNHTLWIESSPPLTKFLLEALTTQYKWPFVNQDENWKFLLTLKSYEVKKEKDEQDDIVIYLSKAMMVMKKAADWH